MKIGLSATSGLSVALCAVIVPDRPNIIVAGIHKCLTANCNCERMANIHCCAFHHTNGSSSTGIGASHLTHQSQV